jgi:hypothetical protein
LLNIQKLIQQSGSTCIDKEITILEKCILPLGMEEGKIPDEAITASSSYEMKSVGPQNARYYKDINSSLALEF